jgi:hypothetical protein
MTFHALNQLIGVGNGFGNGTDQVGVGFDLAVQVAGEIGQVIERLAEFFREGGHVGVGGTESSFGFGKSPFGLAEHSFQLLVDIGGQQPFAKRTGAVELSGGSGEVADHRFGTNSEDIQVGGQVGAVGEHVGELIGQAENIGQRDFNLVDQFFEPFGDHGGFLGFQPIGFGIFFLISLVPAFLIIPNAFIMETRW